MTYPQSCFLCGVLSLAIASTLHADVLMVGDALNRTPALIKQLTENKVPVKPAGANELTQIDVAKTRLVVLAPEKPLPPESRIGLTRFLASGGHVVVVGPHAFDYAPRPLKATSLARYSDPKNYRLTFPERKSSSWTDKLTEPARVETLSGPDGKPALGFRTYLRGFDDFLVEFDATTIRSPKRSVLQFWAKGDAYMDLLAIEIRDTQQKKWFGFVPLTGEWKHYAISLADFLPEGWSNPDEPYPLLKPETIATIGLGTNRLTLWPEKPMTLSLGSVDLSEDGGKFYAPTSALMTLRLPFFENQMAIPAWLFDPFAGTRRISAPKGLQRASHDPSDDTATIDKSIEAWLCPTPNVEHPDPHMGSDHKKTYLLKFERESRRIPIWKARVQDDPAAESVAELRIAGAGKFKGANVALFGVPPEAVQSTPALVNSLARTIVSIVNTPKIAGVTINTTSAKKGGADNIVPTLSVLVQNPLPQTVRGKLVVNMGDGRVRGELDLTVPERAVASGIVRLSAVSADFPFSGFNWSVTFESDAGRDEMHDRVDVERALIHASRHMLSTQGLFPDGRISNHYFGDVYGARAMLAYADLLRRQPERLKSNADLWHSISPSTVEAGGKRFFDMLVRRQNADGSIPMGYGEHINVYNIADTGSMALGAGQIAPLLDPSRREAYLQLGRRFVDWAEEYYIDDTRSAALSAKYPDRAKKGETKSGHYGLGLGHLTRNETGPSWVLPDILGAQTLLTWVDSNPEYRRIFDRNVRAYLDGGYGTVGYFHAEAMVWAFLTTEDAALRQRIAENLRTTFLAALLKGEPNDMYDRGARCFLNGLPLLYYRRYIEDSPAVRAVLLKYVWSFASEDTPNAMRRVAETFPKPEHGESIAASKQASCGAIWAMELIEPGSSLLRVDGFPRSLAKDRKP